MHTFHFVGGLPRSGSTLLCNILNQNPRFYASSTSSLSNKVHGLSNSYAFSEETKGLLLMAREETLERLRRSTREYCETWHGNVKEPVVFDKDRRWNFHSGLVHDLWPESKLITISRDLRSIVASIEKRHQMTAIIEPSPTLLGKTMMNRYEDLFDVKMGTIGTALYGMEDLIRRNPANWVRLRYEDLCSQPEAVMQQLYKKLGEPWYEHDFANVENVAQDVDELYLLKYPHEGCGPVRKPDLNEWKKYVHPDAETKIYGTFPLYQATFNYEPVHPRAVHALATYAM